MANSYIDKVKLLKEQAHAYNVLNKSIVTDEEYDKLFREVEEIELLGEVKIDPESPTQLIERESATQFEKVKHITMMYSQEDVFTKDEMDKWLDNLEEKYGQLNYVCEPKYDGMSLNITYVNGEISTCVTRGNGTRGDDVTENAMTIKSIPRKIAITETIEIKGEVMMSKSVFEKLNREREKEGLDLYANPRNAAAGAMRLKDPSEVAKRELDFYPWGTEYLPVESDKTEDNRLLLFTELGFNSSPFIGKSTSRDGVFNMYQDMILRRDKLDIGLDGMVIKVNDIYMQKRVGYAVRYPRWSVAYKFPPIEKTTRVIDIIDQVGRSGTITPVAIVEKTDIDGSQVSRVTLHNYVDLIKKDIRVNDIVGLIKSGDIIPKITKVYKDRRDSNSVVIVRSIVCPICKSVLEEDGSFLKCRNPNCRPQLSHTLAYFGNRDHMDITGLGVAVADKLISHTFVKTPLDLYKLTATDLKQIPGFKEKTINNLLNAIEGSIGKPLYLLLASLGIHNFGRTMSKILVTHFKTDILDMDDPEKLQDIEGVGPMVAYSLTNYLKANRPMINELCEYTSPTVDVEKPISDDGKYSGEVIVLTGSFPYGKSTLEDGLIQDGAKIESRITKETTLLVIGDKPGASKLNKAKKNDIRTIDYSEL